MQAIKQALADVTLLKQRVAKMALDNTMRGLINDEMLPLMESFMEAVMDGINEQRNDFSELEDAVLSHIEDTEDVISPELSTHLVETLRLGMTVCGIIEEAGVKLENDLADKKLRDAILAFQRGAIIGVEAVLEATVDPDEDEDDDEDDDDKTPVEVPVPKKPATAAQKEASDARDGDGDDRDDDQAEKASEA